MHIPSWGRWLGYDVDNLFSEKALGAAGSFAEIQECSSAGIECA